MKTVSEWKTALREKLKEAMRLRDGSLISLYRETLSAIDNAEAIPVTELKMPVEPVIGKNNEAPRKLLSADDIRQILQHEVEDRHAASAEYARLGQQAEAERLQTAAGLIEGYLNA